MSELCFSRLLGGQSLNDFVAKHWERTPLHVERAAKSVATEILTPDQFEILLFSSSDNLSIVDRGVAQPLNGPVLNGPVLNRSKEKPTHLVSAYHAYATGNTLLLSHLQRRWPPITTLCRNIELELTSHGFLLTDTVSANAYLTPAHAQGFGIHYDNHCALIIQLHGSKRWKIFTAAEEMPIERCRQIIPRDHLGAPLIEVDLLPGDVLYIPRGFPHVANTCDNSSLHLTLGLRTMTWAEAIAELCRSHASFRRSLPPNTVSAASALDYFTRELLPDIAQLDIEGYLQHRVGVCLAALDPLPQGRFGALDDVATITADTLVRQVAKSACVSSDEGGKAVLRFPGSTLRLHVAMKPVFDFIASTEVFTPTDLPTVPATYDAIQLTKLLVQHGLVAPTSADCSQVRVALSPPFDESPTMAPKEPDSLLHSADWRNRLDLTLLRGDSPPTFPHLDWVRCRQRLSDVDCDEIVSACLEFPLTPPTTVDEQHYPGHRQAYSRKIGVNGRTRWLFELLRDVASEATRTSFRLRLTGISRAPQYVEYHPGRGHFARHNDYSHDQAASPRKLTMIIQLSGPEEYDGGQLKTFGVEENDLPQERGSILVLPSFVYHCVTPVTRGVRRALVAWIAGPRLC